MVITFDFGNELIHGACLTGVSEFVIVGGNGTIWTYEMQEWTNRSISGLDLLDVSFLDSERGIAVGEQGTILFSDDGGETWDYRDAPTEASSSRITDVEFFSEIRAYAITDEGGVISLLEKLTLQWDFYGTCNILSLRATQLIWEKI